MIPTFSNIPALRNWITTIPEPHTKLEDIGVGHWEMHGRKGYDSRRVVVLDDNTTGPFICRYQIPQSYKLAFGEWMCPAFNSFLNDILTAFEEEGTSRTGAFWCILQPTIAIHLQPELVIPEILEITSIWVEDN